MVEAVVFGSVALAVSGWLEMVIGSVASSSPVSSSKLNDVVGERKSLALVMGLAGVGLVIMMSFE